MQIDGFYERILQDEEEEPPPAQWEPIVTCITLVIMFGVLVTDKIATESVMLTALTVFYVSGIIDVKEALSGFSSQGLLTVLVLFVVAEGLNKTGALNWYVGKMFGRPATLTGAQLRVIVPIACMSGFINDTPLVTVVLPIVIQWARRINLNPRFILMQLSFAALLGGVITIIGTSTNLIIVGLLIERYPDDAFFQNMPFFGIAIYGVPVALVGCAYMILFTPLLLGRNKHNTVLKATDVEDILLGARLTQWSPAAGRTIKRSGLRDTGGIYLVRVKRQATGNIHTAVGPEFVLNVGDILYFTGLVETFGDFCEEHGLEVVTNEVIEMRDGEEVSTSLESITNSKSEVSPLKSPRHKTDNNDPRLGITLASLLDSTAQERMRIIYSLEDAIRGISTDYQKMIIEDKDRVVVAMHEDLVVLAIDSSDRPGLLLDISKCLARLKLELHHTEAAVRNNRSLSIWRCESFNNSDEFLSEIWSVLHELLSKESGVEAVKQRGVRVVRALVRSGRLIGKTPNEVNFRETYKAAIVSVQKVDGKSYTESFSDLRFEKGDVLVLQASNESPLLMLPPEDFYHHTENGSNGASSSRSSFSLFRSKKTSESVMSEPSIDLDEEMDRIENANGRDTIEAVWSDLEVLKADNSSTGLQREFLTAMKVDDGSGLVGKTVAQAGIEKLPGIYLVSIERPTLIPDSTPPVASFATIAIDEPLQEADVLWFSGTANAIGDLRKIPGLALYECEEVNKMNEKLQYRRLVEAVIARKGPLVGKTVKEARFRTQYGAAVIAVHREGRRIQELPGNIKLQAGDVLLLEAGQNFMANKSNMDTDFTLIAVVEDSSPPRFRMLIPAVVLTIGAYACYVAGLSTLFGTGMVAAILMVIVGCLSEAEARAAIRWEIYLTIAPAFGVGQALINSGVAGTVATFLVKIGNSIGLGDAGLLGAVYLSTVIISQLVANNAAAALIFPIAMAAAEEGNVDLVLMAYNIMFAASAAFMTPFGYQTNLMVMGPGGYNTTDYLIFGTPMQIVMLVATVIFLVVPRWYLCWLGALAVLVGVAAFRFMQDVRKSKQKSS